MIDDSPVMERAKRSLRPYDHAYCIYITFVLRTSILLRCTVSTCISAVSACHSDAKNIYMSNCPIADRM